MVSVPMETDPGGLVGVLNVHTARRRQFTSRDVELLPGDRQADRRCAASARCHRQLGGPRTGREELRRANDRAARSSSGGDWPVAFGRHLHGSWSPCPCRPRTRRVASVPDDPAAAAEQFGEGPRNWSTSRCRRPAPPSVGCGHKCSTTSAFRAGSPACARSIPQIGIDVDLVETRVPDHIEIALYRITQECLQNVVKHTAKASSARLTFTVGYRGYRGCREHCPSRNRRRRSRFRHIRASAGQRRDGRLRSAVDGRTGPRSSADRLNIRLAAGFGHRRSRRRSRCPAR